MGSTPKRPRCSSMNAVTSVGLSRAPWRKHRGGLQDFIRAPQLVVLATQPTDLLALGARRQIRSRAAVSLVLTDLLAQRLRMHPEIGRDVRDRPLALQRQADASLDQLIGVLLRAGHKDGRLPSRQDMILL